MLCSCGTDGTDYFTNDEKWVPILADMYAMQVVVESYDITKRDSIEMHLKRNIYEIHKVDSIELVDFLDNLMINPDKSADMYDRVVKYLDEKENIPNQ
jgi:hypothetical protein